MNKENEIVTRNIELSAEFSHYLFDHPEVEERIPKDAEVILIPEYDQELADYNLRTGRQIENEGGKVMYVKVKSLRAQKLSRIEDLELEQAG